MKFFTDYTRIVIKISSSVFVDEKLKAIRLSWFHSLVEDIAELYNQDKDVIIVSSGAVALGKTVVSEKEGGLSLPLKQAAASVGQINLMAHFQHAFKNHNISVAQILFSFKDKYDSIYTYNVLRTINQLLVSGCIPVINENDVIAPDDFLIRDNDLISAFFAELTTTDLLVLLTDVDGLYDKDPKQNNDAKIIKRINHLDDKYFQMAGSSKSLHGTGGIKSKLAAAEQAVESGCDVILANGKYLHPIQRISEKYKYTFISKNKQAKEKISLSIKKDPINEKPGAIFLNHKGVLAIHHHNNVLADQINEIRGEFQHNDIIYIYDSNHKILAQGKARITSEKLNFFLNNLDKIETVFSHFWDKRVVISQDYLLINTKDVNYGFEK